MGMKELNKAVADETEFAGMPGVDDDFGEELSEEESVDRGDFVGELDEVDELDELDEEDEDDGEESDSIVEEKSEEDAAEGGEEEGEESSESENSDGEEEGESSGDTEGEESSEEQADLEPEPVAKKKTIMVPKQAMDAKIAKYKAEKQAREKLEEENARLRSQIEGETPAPTAEEAAEAEATQDAEIVAMSKEHAELTLQGDVDAAAELNVQILRKMQVQQQETIKKEVRSESVQGSAQRELNVVAQRIAETFPALDPEGTDFNEPLAKKVVMLRDAYIQSGRSLAGALEQAVEDLLPGAHPEYFVASDEEEEEESPVQKRKEAKHKKAVEKKVKTTRQPEKLRGESGRGPAKALRMEDLSDDEFDALSERELAKLRGDIV